MRHQHLISFLILFIGLSTLAHAEKNDKPFPEGVFQENVPLSILPNGKYLRDPTWRNKLTIYRLEPESGQKKSEVRQYFVTLQYADFTPAHTYTCRLAGVFDREGDYLKLAYEYQEAMKCKVSIHYDNKNIYFEDSSREDYRAGRSNESKGCLQFCGGAGVGGMFPLKSKISPTKKGR